MTQLKNRKFEKSGGKKVSANLQRLPEGDTGSVWVSYRHNMSLSLFGNYPSKAMQALFTQTWHWKLLFAWPSVSTQNKAVCSIHEPAPPTLFILGAISLPTFLRNGYFKADGRNVRKLETDWRVDLMETRHLSLCSALLVQCFEAEALWWVCGSAPQQQKAQSWRCSEDWVLSRAALWLSWGWVWRPESGQESAVHLLWRPWGISMLLLKSPSVIALT